MNQFNEGGIPASPRDGLDADRAWERFEGALVAVLSTMVDPEEDDHLILELPGTSGRGGVAPYAQFAGFDSGRVRGELSGNAYLLPQFRVDDRKAEFLTALGWLGNDADDANWFYECSVDETDDLASMVVWALRNTFGIPHPQLLTQRAWGPAASGVDLLGLQSSSEVHNEDGLDDSSTVRKLAVEPTDQADLHRIVGQVLAEKLGETPEVDGDGDYVLQHDGQTIWVRVRTDQPAVEIMACVAQGVRSRRATAVELAVLNRDHLWAQWHLRDRRFWQRYVQPAFPFVPSHFAQMLAGFFAVLSEAREDLVFRTGGQVA